MSLSESLVVIETYDNNKTVQMYRFYRDFTDKNLILAINH